MNRILEQISYIGIVPVVKLDNSSDAAPLAKALCEGGLPCAEVTFRTNAAEEAIRIMTDRYPDMLVGAGTVLTVEQVDKAVAAGAAFIVSPGLNPEVVRHCTDIGVPVTPGCASPSDIEQAISLGLDVVKFFPAEAAGGIDMIKAMSAPYTNVRFMPTGGINAKNINTYLSEPKVIACGGSWMVKDKLIAEGRYDEITRLTREAVSTMLEYRLLHVGINIDGKDNAYALAGELAGMFGFNTTEAAGGVGVFAGTGIELVHDASAMTGEKGHIAIAVNSIERAKYHLGLKGVTFVEESAKYNDDGKCRFIYIDGMFGGFTIHLSRRI